MVAENLLTAIYVEEDCSGQKFDTAQWERLATLVRELSPQAPGGQQVLFEMQRTKVQASNISAFDGCRHKAAQDYRDIFARDLKPSL